MELKVKTNDIFEDYEIKNEELGEGKNGKVLLCVNKKTNEKCALKSLAYSVVAKREVDTHWRSSQNCDYIVKIKDVYENKIQNQLMILVVLELLDGGELFHKIKNKDKFTEKEVAKLMYQICKAVKNMHSLNIAHRDLKPENILFSSKNDDAILKIVDFGFAKDIGDVLKTPCFTPYYVAPEVLSNKNYAESCDIWSLGVIMYILCCGYPPFSSTPNCGPLSKGMIERIKSGSFSFHGSHWSGISDDAKILINRMLETNAEKRIKIDDVINSKWIADYLSVPNTPLQTVSILHSNDENIVEINDVINASLEEMRKQNDNNIKNIDLKTAEDAENSLLKKRLKKFKDN